MNVNEMMKEIAAGLRDAIRETPETYLKEDPEDAYTDLAARLVLKLSGKIAITPAPKDALAEHMRRVRTEATERIFDIFDGWLLKNRAIRHYVTGISPLGRFEITLVEDLRTVGYFQGGSIQDAYAQATQTIVLDESE